MQTELHANFHEKKKIEIDIKLIILWNQVKQHS